MYQRSLLKEKEIVCKIIYFGKRDLCREMIFDRSRRAIRGDGYRYGSGVRGRDSVEILAVVGGRELCREMNSDQCRRAIRGDGYRYGFGWRGRDSVEFWGSLGAPEARESGGV